MESSTTQTHYENLLSEAYSGTGSHAGTDHRHAGSELSQQLAKAVRSIPAYVEHSTPATDTDRKEKEMGI